MNNELMVLIFASAYYLNFREFQAARSDSRVPGDDTYGETPVPIPNTEAKPVRPMVVLTGESRSSPGFIKAG